MSNATSVTLDEAVLYGLHLALEEDFVDVIVLYQQKTPELLAEIKQAWSNQAFAKAAQAAHTIKGSSSNLGLKHLVELCGQLEDALRCVTNNHAEILPLYEQITKEYEDGQRLLIQYCDKYGFTGLNIADR